MDSLTPALSKGEGSPTPALPGKEEVRSVTIESQVRQLRGTAAMLDAERIEAAIRHKGKREALDYLEVMIFQLRRMGDSLEEYGVLDLDLLDTAIDGTGS